MPGCQLRIAGVKGRIQRLSQRQIYRVVSGELMAQLPDSFGEWFDPVADDAEGKVIDPCHLGSCRRELSTQDKPSDHREDLDIEEVGSMHLTREDVQQLRVDIASHQRFHHGRRINNDHRRPALNSLTMSAVDGPPDLSETRSLATIS